VIKNNKNHIVLSIPSKAIVTANWLEKHGISSNLASYYTRAKWLERVGEKAYKRPGDNVEWTGVVNALQEQLGIAIHVSGKSALSLTGTIHYLQMNDSTNLYLTLDKNTHLPKWVESKKLSNDNLLIHKRAILKCDDYKDFLINKDVDGFNIKFSCNELAIMEVLQQVPIEQDFTEAVQLMESLPYMRAKKVQLLLEKSTSIKAKRLYLYLGEKFNHKWVEKIDRSKINLGSGKLMLIKNGTYDTQFKMTIPDVEE